MIKKIKDNFKGTKVSKIFKTAGIFAVMFALRKGIAAGVVSLAMTVMKGSTVACAGALFHEIEYPEI